MHSLYVCARPLFSTLVPHVAYLPVKNIYYMHSMTAPHKVSPIHLGASWLLAVVKSDLLCVSRWDMDPTMK